MKNYVTSSLLLTMFAVATSAAAQTHSREVALAAGNFSFIERSRLGTPVIFENEIDIHSCLPLIVDSRTVAWITRAYEVKNRLFVRRCEPSTSAELVATGHRAGGANDVWERASVDARRHIRFSKLRLPAWSFMSNPTFCDSYIAYWGLHGGANELTVSIYNLVTDTPVASRVVGPVSLETDDEAYLPAPIWDGNCSTALFDGRPVHKDKIDLAVPRAVPKSRSSG
jgi:hypothetical protein